ncbi:hypothetical protein CWB41_03145 [Methylovirgula ligni]|uniref:Glycosyltransferase involved in cell wall biosynthesis n=1 Tax=Methylovirgula ligni TaxID=569860 RepID=A0A3D9YQ97_9HYPH|nr:glycosyltransferase [Methylovirgula ligni]QAY94861.1 hypothetical protein CWB41_03145 [Methylovirgula ligni]REF84714.1 glycosyltransferase involved in cell wall biosynthesis [Methylovirgula ligni]
MDVIVLDNGLVSCGEHSYQLLMEVCDALSQRSISYRVFGMKGMDAAVVRDIGAKPWFSRSLYWGYRRRFPSRRNFLGDTFAMARNFVQRRRTFSEPSTWRVLNEVYRRDLARLPPDVWRHDNVIVVPGISQNQILGLVRHLLSLPWAALPNVVCQLMFTPNWTPWDQIGERGTAYYRQAFDLAGELIGKSLFFTTENEALAKIYTQQFGIKTTLLPIVLRAAQARPKPQGRVRLGFFGYSKSEKGFHLLPGAIEICRARNLPVDFIVQIQHSNWERETVEAEQKLRRLSGIELVEGIMDSAEYAQRTNAVDVTLLPYDPGRFGQRGSGLYTEAVAAGRPVIAARGIYAATEIESGVAEGEIFAPYTSEALADAIERLLPHLAESQSKAAQGAPDFASRHSGAAYVDVILKLVNSARSMPEA